MYKRKIEDLQEVRVKRMKLFPIRENHLYSKAYQKGKKFVGNRVIIYLLPDYASKRLALANPMKTKINRVGITVTKKLGSAVVRNRAKRIIREAFRQADKEKNIKRGFLIVIVARGSIVNAKMQDVKKDLLRGFDKLFFS